LCHLRRVCTQVTYHHNSNKIDAIMNGH